MLKLLTEKNTNYFEVDASEYRYGDLCQKVAHLFLGKSQTKRNFTFHNNVVTVKNLYNVQLSSDAKKDFIFHFRHTGYLGSWQKKTFRYYESRKILKECFILSLRKSLPKNKLCKKRMGTHIRFT